MPDIDRLEGLCFDPDPDERGTGGTELERGQRLRHRLPVRHPGIGALVIGVVLTVASVAGLWAIDAVGELSIWFVVIVGLPGLFGVSIVAHVSRAFFVLARVPPIEIEIDDHPLRPADSAEMLIVQPGPCRPTSISAWLRCQRRVITERMPTPARREGNDIDDDVMFRQLIALTGALECVDDGTHARAQLRIPPSAPRSGKRRDPDNDSKTTEFSWWIDVHVEVPGRAPLQTSAPLRIVAGPFG